MPIRLDIILPCYNPPAADWAQRLPAMVQAVQAELEGDVEISLILVNDGSKTGVSDAEVTWLHSQFPRFHYISYHPNRGKGHALRQGVAVAQGDFQVYTDIDFPYTAKSFALVFKALASGGTDVAAGVRDHRYYTHVPPLRKFISKVLRWLLRTFLRTKITDTQCGLKGFNAAGRKVFLATRIERFLFDLEFIFLASNERGLRIQGVDVELKPGVEFSRARMGILLRESLNFFSIFWRGIWRRR